MFVPFHIEIKDTLLEKATAIKSSWTNEGEQHDRPVGGQRFVTSPLLVILELVVFYRDLSRL